MLDARSTSKPSRAIATLLVPQAQINQMLPAFPNEGWRVRRVRVGAGSFTVEVVNREEGALRLQRVSMEPVSCSAGRAAHTFCIRTPEGEVPEAGRCVLPIAQILMATAWQIDPAHARLLGEPLVEQLESDLWKVDFTDLVPAYLRRLFTRTWARNGQVVGVRCAPGRFELIRAAR